MQNIWSVAKKAHEESQKEQQQQHQQRITKQGQKDQDSHNISGQKKKIKKQSLSISLDSLKGSAELQTQNAMRHVKTSALQVHGSDQQWRRHTQKVS